MHTILTLQETISLVALNLHRHGLDTRLVTILIVADVHLVVVSLRPTLIHTHKHRSPVLALGTSGTGIDLQHSIHAVSLVAKHILEFQILNEVKSGGIVMVHLLLSDHFIFVELKSKVKFISSRLHLLIPVNPLLQVLHLTHLSLRSLRIIPETRSLSAQLLLLHLHKLLFDSEIAVERLSTVFYILKLFCCNHVVCIFCAKLRIKNEIATIAHLQKKAFIYYAPACSASLQAE